MKLKLLGALLVLAVGSLGVVLIVGGTSHAARNSEAQEACSNAVSTGASLVAAYQSTAGVVQSWENSETPGMDPNLPLPGATPDTPIAVCYLTGEFDGIPQAQTVSGPGSGPYIAAIYLVDETTGVVSLSAATVNSQWSFGPPPSS